MRAFSNVAAVLVFFLSISLISATRANLYNMTYPAFVALIAPTVIGERLTLKAGFAVLLTLAGVMFVMNPMVMEKVGFGDLIGLLSALCAAYTMVMLRKARMTDDSFTIIFFLMLIGLIITGILQFISFLWPSPKQLLLLITIGVSGVLGHFFLTYAYRFVTALEGAIISSLRIFAVSILSVLFLEETLTIPIALGGFLIFVSVIVLNARGRLQLRDGE
jgi:drug/metabolite transporter (DMT)-like permease